jgi:hypothetical protein
MNRWQNRRLMHLGVAPTKLVTRTNAWRLFAAAAAKKQDYFAIESRRRLFD